MLFKFLTGKEIGHLQTGLILSQVGGLILIVMGLMVLLPSRLFTFDDIRGFAWIILGVGTYSGWQRLKSSVLSSYSLKCFEINRILHRNCRRQLRTPAILLVSRRDRFS